MGKITREPQFIFHINNFLLSFLDKFSIYVSNDFVVSSYERVLYLQNFLLANYFPINTKYYRILFYRTIYKIVQLYYFDILILQIITTHCL